MIWSRCRHWADRPTVLGVEHGYCWLFFFGECALDVQRSCIVPSAQPRSVAHWLSMRRPIQLQVFEMHTKIIKCHPIKLDRGILDRASSLAALARTPKPGFFKKNPWQNRGQFLAPYKGPKNDPHVWPVRGATVESLQKTKKTHQK